MVPCPFGSWHVTREWFCPDQSESGVIEHEPTWKTIGQTVPEMVAVIGGMLPRLLPNSEIIDPTIALLDGDTAVREGAK